MKFIFAYKTRAASHPHLSTALVKETCFMTHDQEITGSTLRSSGRGISL
jgi:hypothetical protein